MADQKKTPREREAEVNARETLLFMTELNNKNLKVMSDIARGVSVEQHSEYLKKMYKLRIIFNKLLEAEEPYESQE